MRNDPTGEQASNGAIYIFKRPQPVSKDALPIMKSADTIQRNSYGNLVSFERLYCALRKSHTVRNDIGRKLDAMLLCELASIGMQCKDAWQIQAGLTTSIFDPHALETLFDGRAKNSVNGLTRDIVGHVLGRFGDIAIVAAQIAGVGHMEPGLQGLRSLHLGCIYRARGITKQASVVQQRNNMLKSSRRYPLTGF